MDHQLGPFERIMVPVATEADARITTSKASSRLDGEGAHVTVVHVIEKAGGAPDKASVEQREAAARRILEAASEVLTAAGVDHETRILFGTDVAETIVEAADEADVDAIVFTPRGGSRVRRFLSGDVGLSLISNARCPVVSLPREAGDDDA